MYQLSRSDFDKHLNTTHPLAKGLSAAYFPRGHVRPALHDLANPGERLDKIDLKGNLSWVEGRLAIYSTHLGADDDYLISTAEFANVGSSAVVAQTIALKFVYHPYASSSNYGTILTETFGRWRCGIKGGTSLSAGYHGGNGYWYYYTSPLPGLSDGDDIFIVIHIERDPDRLAVYYSINGAPLVDASIGATITGSLGYIGGGSAPSRSKLTIGNNSSYTYAYHQPLDLEYCCLWTNQRFSDHQLRIFPAQIPKLIEDRDFYWYRQAGGGGAVSVAARDVVAWPYADNGIVGHLYDLSGVAPGVVSHVSSGGILTAKYSVTTSPVKNQAVADAPMVGVTYAISGNFLASAAEVSFDAISAAYQINGRPAWSGTEVASGFFGNIVTLSPRDIQSSVVAGGGALDVSYVMGVMALESIPAVDLGALSVEYGLVAVDAHGQINMDIVSATPIYSLAADDSVMQANISHTFLSPPKYQAISTNIYSIVHLSVAFMEGYVLTWPLETHYIVEAEQRHLIADSEDRYLLTAPESRYLFV
tara:strand:+ start:2215 stop:3813 length:1599 start_codon:yes stop_codon:yes gene_type:complete